MNERPNSLTKEQAIALAETEWWKECTDEEIFEFQLNTDLVCMPWGEFHRAAESALGRPVWTHEFAFPDLLRKEFRGEREAPTITEIVNLIPEDKRIVIALGREATP